MNFEFFERLNEREAKEYLARFLELEAAGFQSLREAAEREGIKCNHELSSIAPLFAWIAKSSSITQRDEDPEVPVWIRQTDSYSKNLFDLSEDSVIATMRAAYYLGETFVRRFSALRWAIGDREFAQINQPVVAGFSRRMELPVLLVSENSIRGLITGKPVESVETAVETWVSFVGE